MILKTQLPEVKAITSKISWERINGKIRLMMGDILPDVTEVTTKEKLLLFKSLNSGNK